MAGVSGPLQFLGTGPGPWVVFFVRYGVLGSVGITRAGCAGKVDGWRLDAVACRARVGMLSATFTGATTRFLLGNGGLQSTVVLGAPLSWS